MYLTEKLAASLGKRASSILNMSREKEQIIVYGAVNLLQTIFSILWIVIAGAVLGVLYEALVFSTSGSILRKYSGGVHASSPGRCIIFGTVVSTAVGLFVGKFLYKFSLLSVMILSAFCMVISFIAVFIKAPVDSPQKPITRTAIKKMFKRNSIITLMVFSIIIVILYLFYNTSSKLYYLKIAECMVLGCLWQSMTLTKTGTAAFKKADSILKNIMERG
jgi:accessory gene regulator B